MKRWSKLQKELYNLITPNINFQIHCAVYPMRSQRGSTDLPRYWITLDKEILWDYPKDFVSESGTIVNNSGETFDYPYISEVSDISNLLREYIDIPKVDLFDKTFNSDNWGLTPILISADRRIGKEKLYKWSQIIQNPKVDRILKIRFVK